MTGRMLVNICRILFLAGIIAAAMTCSRGCGSTAADRDSGREQSAGAETGKELSGTIRMVGSTSMEKYVSSLAEAYMEKNPGVAVVVEYTGSSAGVQAVLDGRADIGNLSRRLGEGERGEGLKEYIVAVDAIAVCVDRNNTVKGLTVKQLHDIYDGRIRSWSEVGGEALPIVTVGREAGSGTRGVFEKMLELEEQCVYANELDSSGAVLMRVGITPGAVGYLSLDTADGTVRILELEGELPSAEGVKTGAYGLSRDFIMVTGTEESGRTDLLESWFDFVYGSEGRKIARMSGLVPADDCRRSG